MLLTFFALILDRPCSRCIKRNIGHLCHDEPREAKKPKAETTHENGQQDPKLAPAKAVETSPVNGMPPPPEQAALITQIASSMPPPRNSSTVAPTIVAPSPVSAGSRSNFAAPNAQACKFFTS